MATRYINSDSDGSALNPTRPFDNASYVVNDSYATLPAAYSAASAGDTLEISGGTGGRSYLGPAGTLAKANLTIQGSSIPGHNGTVTLTYNSGSSYTIYMGADAITLNKLTISGSDAKYCVMFYSTNPVLTNVNLTHAGAAKAFLFYGAGGPTTITLIDVFIDGDTGAAATGFTLSAGTVGTVNMTRCWVKYSTGAVDGMFIGASTTVNADYSKFEGGTHSIRLSGADAILNCKNCLIKNITDGMPLGLGAGTVVNAYNTDLLSSKGVYFYGAGTINTYNCFVQGEFPAPNTFYGGTGTWNFSAGDIINGFPYFTKTKENMGYFSFRSDDIANIAYWVTLADYAMNTYGIPMSFYVNFTQQLTAGDKVNLQHLYKTGHDVGVHTRHHIDFESILAFVVTYSGANADMTLVVNADGTLLTIDSTGTPGSDKHIIDLTNASYDTIGEVVAAIEGYDNFTCTIIPTLSVLLPSKCLKTATTALPQTVATNISLDDDVGAGNRFYTEEIINSIADIETAIHEDPTCAAYTCKTLAWPVGLSTTAALTWIRVNTSLVGSWKSSAPWGTTAYYNSSWLGHFYLFSGVDVIETANFKGAGYAGLTTAQQKLRIEQAARNIATYTSFGFYHGLLTHTADQMTLTEFQWFLDELVKYRSPYNIKIDSYANIVNEIKTSGNWTDAGSGYWNRTFAGLDDYHLLPNSPLINAGVDVGLTQDYEGNHVPTGPYPDIGIYEYQPPPLISKKWNSLDRHLRKTAATFPIFR